MSISYRLSDDKENMFCLCLAGFVLNHSPVFEEIKDLLSSVCSVFIICNFLLSYMINHLCLCHCISSFSVYIYVLMSLASFLALLLLTRQDASEWATAALRCFTRGPSFMWQRVSVQEKHGLLDTEASTQRILLSFLLWYSLPGEFYGFGASVCMLSAQPIC